MKPTKLPSLNALRVFEAVARLKSLKNAAQELGVTQSAVSRQLSALEEQLGIGLVQRDNKVQALTATGKELAPELTQIFNRLDRAVNQALNQSKKQRTHIRLGMSHALFQYWLSPALEEFKQLYPHIELSFVETAEYLTTENQEQAFNGLLQGQYDLLLIFNKTTDKQVLSYPLLQTHFYYIARKDVEPEQLTQYIQYSNLPFSWQKPPKNTKKISAISKTFSTLMAASLVEEQNACILIPHIYKKHLRSKSELSWQKSALKPCSLQAYIRPQNENDLNQVAFIQWLEYYSQRFN